MSEKITRFTITSVNALISGLKKTITNKALTDEMRVRECWYQIRMWEVGYHTEEEKR